MNSPAIDERKKLILANETAMARQLALHVMEKPAPRVWMIFVPIFFVFYFWKLKEYEAGLKKFVENYLLPRRKALEAACAAEESGRSFDLEQLASQVGARHDDTRALCVEWLTALVGHFRLLLAASGTSYPALMRSGYRTKSEYLLFCRQLGKAETAFNMALLPTIDGDSTELCRVSETMTGGLSNLRHRQAEEIFS